MDVPKALAEAALRIASEINAGAILVLTETGENCESLTSEKLADDQGQIKVIIATPNPEAYRKFSRYPHIKSIKLTARPSGRLSQAHLAMMCGLRKGILFPGEHLVCLAGNGFADITDSIMVLDVNEEELAVGMLEADQVLAAAVELSMDLAKAGPDGKPVGTAFVVGESKAVLRRSRQLIINTLKSYKVNITDRREWELLKKFATFDGAFVVDSGGFIIAAHRYLNANARVEVPKGLGTRHMAVASMTAATGSKGVTVSGEDGTVRIFDRGKLIAKINPYSKIIDCLRDSS